MSGLWLDSEDEKSGETKMKYIEDDTNTFFWNSGVWPPELLPRHCIRCSSPWFYWFRDLPAYVFCALCGQSGDIQ